MGLSGSSSSSSSFVFDREWQLIPKSALSSDVHQIIYCLVAVSVVMFISGGLLIRLRHEPHIKHRNFKLSLVLLGVTVLLLLYLVARQTFPHNDHGCYLDYLVLGVLPPAWTMAFVGRILNLVILFSDSELRWRRSSSSRSVGATSSSSMTGRSSNPSHVDTRRYSSRLSSLLQASTMNSSNGGGGGGTISNGAITTISVGNNSVYSGDTRLWNETTEERHTLPVDAAHDGDLQVAMELYNAKRSTRAAKARSACVKGTSPGRHVGRPLSAASACSLKDQFMYGEQMIGTGQDHLISSAPYERSYTTESSSSRHYYRQQRGLYPSRPHRGERQSRDNMSRRTRRQSEARSANDKFTILESRFFISFVRQCRYYLTPQWVLYYIAMIVLFQTIVILALWQFSSRVQATPQSYETCFHRWQYFTVELFVSMFYTALLPFCLWCLYHIRDVFGMRHEVFLIGAVELPIQVMICVLQYAPGLTEPIRHYVYTLYIVSIVAAYIITIIYPIVTVFIENRRLPQTTPKSTFLALLDNPTELALLKEFMVMEFTVENMLFYQRCTRLKQRAEPFIEADLPLPPNIREELARIYAAFVRQNAGYQVKLDATTRGHIEECFARGTADATIFDKAIDEVTDQIYRHTFPRFLRWQTKQKDPSHTRSSTLSEDSQATPHRYRAYRRERAWSATA
ncbi:hypothetical protein BDF22DRAFT_703941 [Syncephalis plumigaleata]|nr:hypothetical protein BDF22DRAFT_703941 [Syncephalis plumigaleata]